MKRRSIFLIVCGAILFSLSNAFYLYNDLKSFWEDFNNIISALSAIVTLLIALLLYRKFGADQSLVDKQAEVVLELIDQLRKRKITIEAPGYHINLNLHRLHLEWDEFKRFYDGKLIFAESYLNDAHDIARFARNKLLPVELVGLLHSLDPVATGDVEKDQVYGKVFSNTYLHHIDITTGNIEPVIPSDNILRPLYTSVEKTKTVVETDFCKLVNDWKAIADASKKWIEENASGHKLNLNG